MTFTAYLQNIIEVLRLITKTDNCSPHFWIYIFHFSLNMTHSSTWRFDCVYRKGPPELRYVTRVEFRTSVCVQNGIRSRGKDFLVAEVDILPTWNRVKNTPLVLLESISMYHIPFTWQSQFPFIFYKKKLKVKLCLYVNFSNHGYIKVISRDVTNYCLQLPFLVLSEIEQLAKLMAI